MGICGTAMGNAALLLRSAGHEVLGSDTGIYPPMSTVLNQAGITIYEGYDPERLNALKPDRVVIGNAMSRGNSEVEWLLETRAFAYSSLPEILAEFILAKRSNIVVCGTHGKTTTTSLCAYLLRANKRDPGYLIGGVPRDLPQGCHVGSHTDPFVIEGDEYDSAFFDKRSKFIHYLPHIAVLNNLEFDHADIFRDLQDVKRTFIHLTRIVPRNGYIVMNGDDENLKSLGDCAWTQVVRVGVADSNDVQITQFSESLSGVTFDVNYKGKLWGKVSWNLPGIYNARNAVMAMTAATLALYPEDPTKLQIHDLSSFKGVQRRQEILASVGALKVIEDFGHHPTAILETLKSLRARYPQAKLTCVFEPRSNTARVKTLEADFMRAFAAADEIYLGPVHRLDKLELSNRFDTRAVAEQLNMQGRKAQAFPSNGELLRKLKQDTLTDKTERVVTFFSNGSFDGIISDFAKTAKG